MAGSFRIAEGYVEVTADQSSYDRSMERLKSSRQAVKVTINLDDKDALARLKELSRERLATVKIRVDDAALKALKLGDLTVNVKPVITDAALRKVQGQLDKLTADRVVRIRADVDTRVGAQEIQNLTRRQRVRIGVDVDTRVAAADLANLTRTRTARVNVDLRTGDATARLAALSRDRRVGLDVDVRAGALSSLAEGGSGIAGLSSRFAQIAAAAIGALPAVASLGSSLAQMGPAAAVTVPAVLSLATAFAAVKIGTSGIGDAIKASLAPAATSGSSAASSLRQVQNAQESLANATRRVKDAEVAAAQARVKAARDVKDAQQALGSTVQDVADANHRALESVAGAERDLMNAQKAARQAQLDLTAARKAAKAGLEDLNNQLTDAQLSQRDDVLALQDAQQNLDAVKAQGAAANQEDLAKAQLALDQAVQQLKEQQLQVSRLQEQTDAANQAGIEGSDQVTQAKQQIVDAQQDVQDKTQSLRDAQTDADRAATDGALRVAKAERDVADARAAATQAAVDGARQVQDAQQAVTDATRALADAQAASAAGVNKVADAMAKLSPNARAFVTALTGQRAAWTALKLDVQDRLMAGLGTTFTTMANSSLPVLRGGLGDMAGVLNQMATGAMDAVTNLSKTGTLKSLFSGLSEGMKPLAKIPGQFVTALGQIGVAASPAFKRLTTAAGGAATGIMDKLNTAFKNGHLEKAIDDALDVAKQFGSFLGDVFGTLGNVFKAAAAGGGNALGTLGEAFKELRRITALPEVQKGLTSIFKLIDTVAKLLVGSLGVALGQLIVGIAPIATAISQVLAGLGDVGPLIGGLLLAVNPVLGAFVLLAPVIGKIAKPLVGLVQSLAPLLTMLSDFIGGLVDGLAPILGAVIDVLGTVLKAVAPVFAKLAPVILQVVESLAGPLTDVIMSLVPLIGPLIGIMSALDLALLPLLPSILQLLPPVAQLAIALVNLAVHVLTPLLPLVTGLATLLAGVLAAAIGVLVPVINTVVGWITKFVDAITAAVDWIVDKFTWLYDTLVGHSIVPDLVNAIVGWFTQLWDRAKKIFTDLMNGIVAIWNNLWSTVRSAWNGFWSGLSTAITNAKTSITNTFTSIRTSISGVWSGLWTGVRDTFGSLIGTVQSRISSFSTGVKSVFTSLRDSIGTIWKGIQEKFASPVRFVVGTVYNNGLRFMWDTIASKVGMPQLPTIKLGFNTGGVVPGDGKRDTVPAMLTPGERILSLAQVARLGGHRAIDSMVGRNDNMGPRFGVGGIVGDIGHGVGNAISGGVDWVKSIAVGGLEAAARKAVSAVVQPLINRIPGGGSSPGSLVKAVPQSALSGILGALGKKDKAALQSGQIPYKAGAGVAQWAPTILKALSLLGQSSGWLGTVERRMNQESGGNPSVVNRWDSNWIAGTPSVGLMQVIGPTFKSHAGPFGKTGPFLYGTSIDPLANTFAGLHYAVGRYGSLSALNRPGGYDSGGLLQPGATMAVNRTGRPERVLTADHTAKLDAVLDNAAWSGSIGGDSYEIHLTVHTATIPNDAELQRFANTLADPMIKAIRAKDRSRNR